MSLTGTGLPVLLGLVALALLAAVALERPRLAGRPTPVRVGVRAGQALALNLVVLLLGAVALNDQYDFYVSWGDVFSAGGVPRTVVHGADPGQAAAGHARGPGLSQVARPAVLPPLPAPGPDGALSYRVHGRHSGVTGQVLVLLPADYGRSGRHTYPVIEALHGFPGSPQSWLGGFHLGDLLHGAVSARQLAESIVVLPQIDTPRWLDTECVDAPAGAGPQVETWLSRDVPEFVVGHFRVRTDRASWAAIGYSYGGWCAALVTMHHPDVFGAAIVLSGYFRPDFSMTYVPFRRSSPQERADDLVALARTDPPPVALWVLTSKGDSLSYPSTAVFMRAVRPPTSLTVDLLSSGGHREQTMVEQTPRALAWLGGALAGFRP